jgi:hypothetical protein
MNEDSPLLGVRWVQTIMSDSVVRFDWNAYLAARRDELRKGLSGERDEIRIRWLQGQLLELDFFDAFIDQVQVQLNQRRNLAPGA